MHDLHACKTLVDYCVQDHRRGPQDTSQLNVSQLRRSSALMMKQASDWYQAFTRPHLGRILHCNPVCSKDIHQILRPPSALVVR